MRYGVDSHQVPTAPATYYANLKAAGRDFVGRYLYSGAKGVTAGELTAAAAANVDMFFYYESSATRAMSGNAAGQADVAIVLALLTGLGIPTTCPVYYTVDFDAYHTPGGMAAVDNYFDGIIAALTAESLSVAQVGAYGGWHVVDYLLRNELTSYTCQALAWQYGHGWHADANIRQTAVNYWVSDGHKYIYNDKCTAVSTDFGQFREGATPEVEPDAPTDTSPLKSALVVTSLTAEQPRGMVVRSTDDLVLCLMDSDGNEIELRGEVMLKQGGLAPLVTVRDPAAFFDRIPVEWDFCNQTVSEIVRQIMENPTGQAATGYVLHIEDASYSGAPITLSQYNPRGMSLASVLAELQEYSGARWCFESRDGTWHFWWGNPSLFANWGTLRDDIDSDAEDSETFRVYSSNGEIDLDVSRLDYANRVRYPANVGRINLLPGIQDWDDVWTEDLTRWHTFSNGVTQELAGRAFGYGNSSIKFSYTHTYSAGTPVPEFINLGYIVIPGAYVDMTSNYWGSWYVLARKEVTTSQDIAQSVIQRSEATIKMGLMTGAYPGPSLLKGNCFVLEGAQRIGRDWTSLKWPMYGVAKSAEYEPNNLSTAAVKTFDLSNVCYIMFRAQLTDPSSVTALTTGNTITWDFYLDHLRPVGATPGEDAPTVSQHYVQTDAVDSGEELPIEARIDNITMDYAAATSLANLYLDELSRPKVTLPRLRLSGIRNVPVMCKATCELSTLGISDTSYPVSEVEWKVLDAGDTTEVTLGDLPSDSLRSFERLKHHIDRERVLRPRVRG